MIKIVSVNRIIKNFKHDQRVNKMYNILSEKDRMIRRDIYLELKKKRICQLCGNKFSIPLEIHHVISKKDGGDNDKQNLIAICSNCHNIIHGKVTKMSSEKNIILEIKRLTKLKSEIDRFIDININSMKSELKKIKPK